MNWVLQSKNALKLKRSRLTKRRKRKRRKEIGCSKRIKYYQALVCSFVKKYVMMTKKKIAVLNAPKNVVRGFLAQNLMAQILSSLLLFC